MKGNGGNGRVLPFSDLPYEENNLLVAKVEEGCGQDAKKGFFKKKIYLFYLFIFGCIGSSLLCAGFL